MSQDYLGVDKVYYEPTDRGAEADMAALLEKFRRLRQDPAVAEREGD